mgnify:CR=1 FL=1
MHEIEGLNRDRVARGERCQHARRRKVDEAGATGLAHLLDEDRGRRLLGAPGSSLRRLGVAGEHAKALDVALRDPVRGVALQRLLVGLERLRVATELGERLAEPVVGIDVGAKLEELAVRVDRLLPFATRRMRDRGLAELAA